MPQSKHVIGGRMGCCEIVPRASRRACDQAICAYGGSRGRAFGRRVRQRGKSQVAQPALITSGHPRAAQLGRDREHGPGPS